MIHDKIEETDGRFLIGGEEDKARADWSSLFDGSCHLAVQRSVIPSQTKTSTPFSSPGHPTAASSTPLSSSKKRRAPPPPPNREPYHSPAAARPARPPPSPPASAAAYHHHHQEKENCSRLPPTTRSKTGRPSLDAKFSAIIQQLQRSNAGGSSSSAASRKHAPLGVLDIQPQGQPPYSLLHVGYQSDEAATADDHGLVRQSQGPVPAPRTRLRKSFRERMNLKAL